MKLDGKKIVITGGSGFLGSHLVKELHHFGVQKSLLRIPRSHLFDLRRQEVCEAVVKDADIVFHLAANVGGIGYNQKFPGSLFYDNLAMGVHLLEESRKAGVKKFIGIGTICAYPKFTPVPFREDQLWNGYPEETNAPYGLAKKMLLVQSQSYRQQYGFSSIYLLPVNLYGPGDNFSPESSHVIPALIKKFHDAKVNNQKTVSVWGTGKPTREFLYVKDCARAIALAAEQYDGDQPVNIGSSYEISIHDLATLIAKITGFSGKILFNHNKPDGQPRRKLDVSRAKEAFHFESKIPFEKGLRQTYSWYIKHFS